MTNRHYSGKVVLKTHLNDKNNNMDTTKYVKKGLLLDIDEVEDQPFGRSIADKSGYGNKLTLNEKVSRGVLPFVGNFLRFNDQGEGALAGGQVIPKPNITALNSQFSFAISFKAFEFTDAPNASVLFFNGNEQFFSFSFGLALQKNGQHNDIIFLVLHGVQIQACLLQDAEVQMQKIYHLVCIKDGQKGIIFLNGIKYDFGTPFAEQINPAIGNIEYGKYDQADGMAFKGEIYDNLKIWDRPLRDAEAQAVYYQSKVYKQSKLFKHISGQPQPQSLPFNGTPKIK